MELEPVCIHGLCTAADRTEAETLFAFLNEVFHFTTPTVKPDDLIWLRLHGRYDKCVQEDHLSSRFFYLEYHTAGMGP